MKITKIYCERCGKEIPIPTEGLKTRLINKDWVKHYVVVSFEFSAGHFVDGDHAYPIDLCLDCTKQTLIDIVESKDIVLGGKEAE